MLNKFDTEKWGCIGWILAIIIILAIAFGLLCFEAWLVMLLWNAVISLLWATAPELGFWAAMGLMLLCNLLFGSVVRIGSGKK